MVSKVSQPFTFLDPKTQLNGRKGRDVTCPGKANVLHVFRFGSLITSLGKSAVVRAFATRGLGKCAAQ